jgi:hypothetical protein
VNNAPTEPIAVIRPGLIHFLDISTTSSAFAAGSLPASTILRISLFCASWKLRITFPCEKTTKQNTTDMMAERIIGSTQLPLSRAAARTSSNASPGAT